MIFGALCPSLYPSSSQCPSGEMSLSKKRILSKDPLHAHPHTPTIITIITHCQCNLSDSPSDNRPPSPHRLKCDALIPNHACTTNDSGDQTATPRYANRMAKQLARSQAVLQGNHTLVQQLQHDHSRRVLSLKMCRDCTGVPNRGRCAFRPRVLQPPRCQRWPDALQMCYHW